MTAKVQTVTEDSFKRYIWYNMYLYVGVTFFLWWKKHYNFSQLKQVIAYDHLILIINEPFLFRVSKIYFHAWYRKRNCLSPIQGHPRRLHFIITVENQVFNCNDAMGWLFWPPTFLNLILNLRVAQIQDIYKVIVCCLRKKSFIDPESNLESRVHMTNKITIFFL